MSGREPEKSDPLAATVRMPDDVVIRAFAEETVALNLRTGQYHGLNAVAAAMLDAVVAADPASAAVPALAGKFDQPQEVIERDLASLLRELADRGLVELGDSG